MSQLEVMSVTTSEDGVAVLTWNCADQAVNAFSEASSAEFVEKVEALLANPQVKGVVIASAKSDFHSGADLKMLQRLFDSASDETLANVRRMTTALRQMECAGKTLVAAINGHALGGGLEMALACHARIVADDGRIKIGLPEVKLGLMPGFGGTQRLPRLIGAQAALRMIGEGRTLNPAAALKQGVVTEVVPAAQLLACARQWVLDHPGASQPWDSKGFKVPGGAVQSVAGVPLFAGASATTRKMTYGNYPAATSVLNAIYHGLQLPFEAGQARESRLFVGLIKSPQARAMVNTLFFGINAANSLKSRPEGFERREFTRIGVVGAGLMGAGIAHVAAKRGLQVVVIDQDLEGAAKARRYSEKVCATEVAKGKLEAARAEALLARIELAQDYASLKGCEVVIEAVFEDRSLKEQVLAAIESAVEDDTLIASNTSTLPIGSLDGAVRKPERFVGLHFFSPVEKMPLVEVISGANTSPKTLAQSLDFCSALGKTPIAVGDGRAFYTTRVFASYVTEGLALLSEGCPPALLENAARCAGMPMGPLRLADMINIDLIVKISDQTHQDMGGAYTEHAGVSVARAMVAQHRLGEKVGAGFYEYKGRNEARLWTGLGQLFPQVSTLPEAHTIGDRLLKAQANELALCMAQGVIKDGGDADVGSILGWGFPPFTGGVASYAAGLPV